MFAAGISKQTKNSLALLKKADFLDQFYLAEETACALWLGHRFSYDLDFFSQKSFSAKGIINFLTKKRKFKLDQSKKNTLLGTFEKTKISFFKYNYLLIDKLEIFEGVKIAGIKDLIAMKIDAIATRGVKRDFIDLYFLCQKTDLIKSFSFYRKKYKGKDLNLLHAVRALTYFADANKDKMPEMLVDCNWQDIKKYFLIEAPKLLEKLLNLY
jgi:hypothetical protein